MHTVRFIWCYMIGLAVFRLRICSIEKKRELNLVITKQDRILEVIS